MYYVKYGFWAHWVHVLCKILFNFVLIIYQVLLPELFQCLRNSYFSTYLALEYAENGTVSIRTDVYAFGIVLLQLTSGRKAVDLKRNEQE